MLRTSALGLFAILTAAPCVADVSQIVADRDNTLFESGDGSLSSGSGQHVYAGRVNFDANGWVERRAVLHFDVSSIPANATIVSASEFGAKTLESHASSALFVACEPSDSVLAGVAAEAYAGSVIITAHARADDSSVASAMNARGFKEDLAKRAISFTASGRPYLFALWTR